MPYVEGDLVTDDLLYRRIPPFESHFQSDIGTITSLVFFPETDEVTGEEGISCYLALDPIGHPQSTDLSQYKTPEEVLAGQCHAKFGLVKIEGKDVVGSGFSIIYDPKPEHGGPGHVWITRNATPEESRKKKKDAFRKLSKSASVVLAPSL